MNITGIYCYIDKKDGSIVYIGKDSYIYKNTRHNQHYQSCRYNHQVINRVLQNNLDRYQYKVLLKGEISQKLLNAFEKVFIRMYDPKFNYTNGGDGGFFGPDNIEIIRCGEIKGKQIYGLKKEGVIVLTSVNRARIFSACFNLNYPVMNNR